MTPSDLLKMTTEERLQSELMRLLTENDLQYMSTHNMFMVGATIGMEAVLNCVSETIANTKRLEHTNPE